MIRMSVSENVLHHSKIEPCPWCAAASRVVEAARRVDRWAHTDADKHDPLRELRAELGRYEETALFKRPQTDGSVR